MHIKSICCLFLLTLILSCTEKKEPVTTPWGTSLDGDSIPANDDFKLNDIVNNGELIMLTLTGPDNYYDYHGHGMGTQYMLCEKFAQKLGVSLRVEVCKDTTELVTRLRKGDGDIAAFQLPRTIQGVKFCGTEIDSLRTQWAVQSGNNELADALNRWFKPGMIKDIREEEAFLLSTRSVTRRVYSPMLNRAGGVISHYDHYFQKYAPLARWDWRLMAAQCYQESTFDPQARSWAGACGLMQIMPRTAAHLGLPQSKMFDPESNIAASAKYLQELESKFADVRNRVERYYFVLASYNGGYFHIRDAMALARKYNRDPYRWDDVSEFVLKLRESAYYTDPVVRYGYMRGDETVGYVSHIRDRWAQYRGVARSSFSGSFSPTTPQRAKHKYRFHI